MWLVDTSIWIDHFRHGKSDLAARLAEGLVLMHPFILGELACGSLKDRGTLLSYLMMLPKVTTATDSEVLHLVETGKLWGRGLGWIDAHLLASASLSRCQLWTSDKKLAIAGEELGLA